MTRSEARSVWEKYGQLAIFLLAITAQLVFIARWTGVIETRAEARDLRISHLEQVSKDYATKIEVNETKERIALLRNRLCDDIKEIKEAIKEIARDQKAHQMSGGK